MKILVSTLSYDGNIPDYMTKLFFRIAQNCKGNIQQYILGTTKPVSQDIGMTKIKNQQDVQYTQNIGDEVTIDFFTPTPDLTNRARNKIILEAIGKSYDLLLMIDSDNPISSIGLEHLIYTMIKEHAGVVCAAVPSRIPVSYNPDNDAARLGHNYADNLPGIQNESITPGNNNSKLIAGQKLPIIAAVKQSWEGGYKHYLPYRSLPARKNIEIDSCGTGCVLFDVRYLKKLHQKYGQYMCEFDTRRHITIQMPQHSSEIVGINHLKSNNINHQISSESIIGNQYSTEIVTLDDGTDYVIAVDESGEQILKKIDLSIIPASQKIVTPIGEDVLMIERLKQLGAKIVMDCQVTAKHRCNGSGFSKIDIENMELPLEIFIPVYKITQKIWNCIKDNMYLWRDLFEHYNLKVTFVHDGPISMKEKAKFSKKLEKEYPIRRGKGRISVIAYNGNKGVNYARSLARHSQAHNVLILNDDCIVGSDALIKMMNAFIENKQLGVVSPFTRDNNNPNGDGMKFGNVAGRCFMMPTMISSLVLPIDARINIWYGDDWVFHAVKGLGLEIAYVGNAVCEHLGSETVGKPGKINPAIAKIIEKDKIGRKKIITERGRKDTRFDNFKIKDEGGKKKVLPSKKKYHGVKIKKKPSKESKKYRKPVGQSLSKNRKTGKKLSKPTTRKPTKRKAG